MNGLVNIQSFFTVDQTVERATAILAKANICLFVKIDHGLNASQVGLTLRPTVLLVFGDPKAGTALMQDRQTAGIDLPLKLLVWEDEQGKIWVSYNDLHWIGERHGLTVSSGAVQAIGAGLQKLVGKIVEKG